MQHYVLLAVSLAKTKAKAGLSVHEATTANFHSWIIHFTNYLPQNIYTKKNYGYVKDPLDHS